MSDLEIFAATDKKSMDEVRPALDALLAEQFPGGMLKRQWQDDVLHLSGPGASGTIAYEDGRVVGRAALKPPASLMRPVIESKIRAAIEKAAR